MAKVKLELGAEIETLGPGEFRKGLDEFQSSWSAEVARGLKHMRMPRLSAVPRNNTIDLGGDSTEAPFEGPREGFVWAVQRISIYGDSPADIIEVWRGRNDFITNITTWLFGVFEPGHCGLILHPGETLRFHCTSVASTSITVTGDVIEAPGPQIWKLIS